MSEDNFIVWASIFSGEIFFNDEFIEFDFYCLAIRNNFPAVMFVRFVTTTNKHAIKRPWIGNDAFCTADDRAFL